ncbi:MAG: redoxin domain-containing protein [Polyangiaceae bacterium]
MIAPRSFAFRPSVLVAIAAFLATSASACHGNGVTDLDGRPADPFLGGGGADAKATVLVFVSTDCPISNRYAPELRRLYERYSPQGIAFRLVYPTVQESPAMIRAHVREYGFPFEALRDPGHTLVARAKATVTPESAVFARGGALVYHGRIDDRNIDLGEARPEPTRRDLEEALDAVLAGRAPAETEARAIGCAIAGAK